MSQAEKNIIDAIRRSNDGDALISDLIAIAKEPTEKGREHNT